MTISDLIPSTAQLKALQGVEKDLVQNRRNSLIGALIALVAVIVQVVAAIQGPWLGNLGQFLANFFTGNWSQLFGDGGLSAYEAIGLSVVVAGVVVYAGYGYLAFFFKESEEPFRYTFWIDAIEMLNEDASDPPSPPALKDLDRLDLLHHDVKERLNQRIRRLSLLAPADAKEDKSATENRSPSNIKISGQCAVRNDDEGVWLHIMPTVRIGPSGTPETLAQSIKFKPATQTDISASDYGLIVEQVYSSIATEIYRQIKEDIEQKVKLFPFGYLRAVALVNEAMDFERSNTIDAYDHAIDLYETATRYYIRNKVKTLSRWIASWPIVWRKEVAFAHREARAFTGYARCLIYRRTISALSGLREQNTLFRIPLFIEEQLDALARINRHIRTDSSRRLRGDTPSRSRGGDFLKFLTYPRDNWVRLIFWRPQENLFELQRKLRAEAHIVLALTCQYLNDIDGARMNLARVRAIAPVIARRSALYYLAAGEIEPEINKKLLHMQKAAELDPKFEIAHFQLAFYEEMRLRMEGDLSKFRIESVIRRYRRVSTINPGNISSQLNRGYLHWLAGQLDEAKKVYREGREKRSIVAATFTGDLVYGLARVAAEQDKLELGFELYSQAFAADPSVAAYTGESAMRSRSPQFAYIGSAILSRYREFLQTARENIQKARENTEGSETFSSATLDTLLGYVLNDFGNACLNYFHRHGDERCLREGINAFEQARNLNPGNPVVNFNLYNAYSWTDEYTTAVRRLKQAQALAASWPKVAIELAQSTVREKRGHRDRARGSLREADSRLRDAKSDLDARRQELEDKQLTLSRVRDSAQLPPQSSNAFHAFAVSISQAAGKALREQVAKVEREIEKATESRMSIQTECDAARAALGRVENDFDLAVESAVDTIVTSTMLAPLFEGRDDSPSDKIDRLLEEHDRIDWGKLSHDDVDALLTLASVLQYSDWETALALCHHLQKTYRQPNNFDVAALIHEIEHANLPNAETAGTSRLRQSLQYTLASEPVYFAALVWYVRMFEPATIEETYDQLPADYHQRWDVYHCLMGHVHRYLGSEMSYDTDRDKIEPLFDRSIEEFRRPLLANPDKARFHTYIADAYSAKADYVGGSRIGDAKTAGKLRQSALTHYQSAYDLDKRSPYRASDLGAIYEKLDRHDDADRCYKRAVRADGDNAEFRYRLARVQNFITAGKGLKSGLRKAGVLAPWIAKYHTELANHLDNPDEIESAMRMAIRLDPDFYGYYNQLGNRLYQVSAYSRSVNWYEAAIHREPNHEILQSNLAGAYEQIVESIVSGQDADSSSQTAETRSRAIGFVDRAIEALQQAADIQLRDEPYAQRLQDLQKNRRLLSVYTPNVFRRIPVVTPMAIEVADNLIPMIDSPEGDELRPELARVLEDMRSRVLDQYGVRIPGVRFRGNDELADGTYVMMLFEVPLVSASIELGRRFCTSSPAELAERGLEEAIEEALYPMGGSPGSWISEPDWNEIEDAGLELWPVIEYPIRHLEALLVSNLAGFMGIQEVVNTIEQHVDDKMNDVVAADGGLPALTGVVRGLLTERVPVTEFATICDVFLSERAKGADLVSIVETLRREPKIRTHVPGVDDDSSLYTVLEDYESAITDALDGSGDSRVLALAPELCQEMLAAVRDTISGEYPAAMLVKESDTRPYLRKLLGLEFPELSVVARGEMSDGHEDRIIGEVGLNQSEGTTQ